MKYFAILLLLTLAAADNFFYRRILDCIENNAIKCTRWNESTTLTYSAYYSTFCFSENTYLQTQQGPKPMKDVQVHDRILSFDGETGKNAYSKVVAWLHRDTNVVARYDVIKTKEGPSFQASDYHNIAFVNSQGKIQFKFAKDLSPGDQLVGFPNVDSQVESVADQGGKRGLYSPFTQAGNFYIYETSVNQHNQDTANKQMILVHVLSQVKNPNSELSTANRVINLWESLGLNVQPKESAYEHPLVGKLSFLFGRDWVGAEQLVYIEPEHEQALPSSYRSTPSYSSSSSSSSYSYHPSYSSSSYSPTYSSSSSSYPYYTTSSTSSSYRREKERQDRMKAMGLAVSIVQETPLL